MTTFDLGLIFASGAIYGLLARRTGRSKDGRY